METIASRLTPLTALNSRKKTLIQEKIFNSQKS